MALWSCVECEVCACMFLYVCLYSCLCMSICWSMNVSANAFIALSLSVYLSVVATLHLHWLNQILLKVKHFLWLFTVITYNVQLQPEADWGWHGMYANGKAVDVDLYNVHLIGLSLFLSGSTCVFCTQQAWQLLYMTFACRWPVFLQV